MRKDTVHPPIHTEYFHYGGATTNELRCEWSQRRQFLRHGREASQHDLDVQILADVHVTLYVTLERSVGFLPEKFDWNNTSTQRKRSAPY